MYFEEFFLQRLEIDNNFTYDSYEVILANSIFKDFANLSRLQAIISRCNIMYTIFQRNVSH